MIIWTKSLIEIMTGQSIEKCSALFDRIMQGYFTHSGFINVRKLDA